MRLQLNISAIMMGLCLTLAASGEAKAATFTIADPEVDFEVIDGGNLGLFDGLGDEVFSTFNTVVLGSFGEAAEFAEFDLRDFSVTSGEVITSATFQVQLTSLEVGGLGVPFGVNPNNLGVYGYVGNGIAEASDFQAGTLLKVLNISSASVGDILSFDVTAFINNLVNGSNPFAGFGIRAQEFGGLAIEESSSVGVPRLTIKTAAVTASIPESSSTLGLLAFGVIGASSAVVRNQKHHK